MVLLMPNPATGPIKNAADGMDIMNAEAVSGTWSSMCVKARVNCGAVPRPKKQSHTEYNAKGTELS